MNKNKLLKIARSQEICSSFEYFLRKSCSLPSENLVYIFGSSLCLRLISLNSLNLYIQFNLKKTVKRRSS